MDAHDAANPEFERCVRESFARQKVMDLIDASLTRVEPGLVEIELPFRDDLTQQHGYLHAGISTTIADSAGGYAAYSLMPIGSSILAVEFKMNLLAPARGDRFRAQGRVVKAGRRLTISEVEVIAVDGDREVRCLFGMQTSMCLPETSDLPSG